MPTLLLNLLTLWKVFNLTRRVINKRKAIKALIKEHRKEIKECSHVDRKVEVVPSEYSSDLKLVTCLHCGYQRILPK